MPPPDVQAHGQESPNHDQAVWKWIAASLLLIMIAGAPSYASLLQKPSNTEFELVRERQEIILQRLAVIDLTLANSNVQSQDLWEAIAEIRELLSGRGIR